MSAQCMEAQQSQAIHDTSISMADMACLLALYKRCLELFDGFILDGEYFRMPKEYIDISAKIDNLAELKIVQYILRHTYGYRDYDGATPKMMTLDELMFGRKKRDGTRMDNGTGLCKPSAIMGVRRAIQHGYITCEIDDSDAARVKHYYQPKIRPEVKEVHLNVATETFSASQSEVKPANPAVKDLNPDVKGIDSSGQRSSPRSEERSLERTSMNQPKRKKDSAPSRLSSFSLLTMRMNYEYLRTAPWSPETLLALASRVLPVPDGDAIQSSGNQEAIEQWYTDWYKPAERLYIATISLEPRLAWQRIDMEIRYMVTAGSPSWWQQARARKSPITLRHAADNFTVQYADLHEKRWNPPEITPYDGPGYEAGYTPTVSQAVEALPPDDTTIEVTAGEVVVEAARITRKLTPDQAITEDGQVNNEELRADQAITANAQPVINEPPMPVQPLRGMSSEEVDALAAQIAAQYPAIQGELTQFDDGSYALRISDSPTTSFTLRSANDWLRPAPVTQRRIAQASDYGVSLHNEQAAHSPPPPVIEAQPAQRRRGMAEDEAQALAAQIAEHYPNLLMDVHPVGDERFVLGLQIDATGQCVGIRRIDDWLRPSPRLQGMIDQAMAYGEAMARLASEECAGGEDKT